MHFPYVSAKFYIVSAILISHSVLSAISFSLYLWFVFFKPNPNFKEEMALKTIN
jgi:hypothetical protein